MTKRLTPETDYGLFKCGERNKNAKLKKAEVQTIKILLAEGNKQQSLAIIFGVSRSAISMIKTKKTWKWLE